MGLFLKRGYHKIWKKGEVDNIGGLHKIGGLGPLCQLCCNFDPKAFEKDIENID